jgi:hypothetical protein
MIAYSKLLMGRKKNLQGTWRTVVRFVPLSAGAPDYNNCACGCEGTYDANP